MDDVSTLYDRIDRNIELLNKKPVPQINFSLLLHRVEIRDYETVDLKLEVVGKEKDKVYPDFASYWGELRQILDKDSHPGLKAKAAFEMRSAIRMYDRTFDAGDMETPQRAIVQDDLDSLINYFTSQPAETPKLGRYEGRTETHSGKFMHAALKGGVFLAQNLDAIYSMVFSSKEEIDKINSHVRTGKFANGIPYMTELKAVRDE